MEGTDSRQSGVHDGEASHRWNWLRPLRRAGKTARMACLQLPSQAAAVLGSSPRPAGNPGPAHTGPGRPVGEASGDDSRLAGVGITTQSPALNLCAPILRRAARSSDTDTTAGSFLARLAAPIAAYRPRKGSHAVSSDATLSLPSVTAPPAHKWRLLRDIRLPRSASGPDVGRAGPSTAHSTPADLLFQ